MARIKQKALPTEISIASPVDADLGMVLGFLRLRQIAGVEAVGELTYERTVSSGDLAGRICATIAPNENAVRLRVPSSLAGVTSDLVKRAHAIFDLGADSALIRSVLRRDARFRPLLNRNGAVHVPGCWDPFELAVRAILGQQVSVAAAATMAARVARAFGRPFSDADGDFFLFPAPELLADADLTSIGLIRTRAAAIRSLSRAVLDNQISFDPALSLAETVEQFTALPGIGLWTAHYIAMRAFHHADAFPASDLILRRAASDNTMPLSVSELTERAEAWRPCRAYAAVALWQDYGRRLSEQSKAKGAAQSAD